MGCDIHIVLEFKDETTGKWIGEFATDNYGAVGKGLTIRERDYEFFAEIAAVRGTPSPEGFYPKYLPKDISELAWSRFMRSPSDHHTPSHLTPEQFCEAWLRCNEGRADNYRKNFLTSDLLGVEEDDEREYRVVFWFDN